MVKAERISNNNIFYFMKEHPELRLHIYNGRVIDISFPENCTSKTFAIINGKITYIAYSVPGCDYTSYDISKDPNYEANIQKIINELS